MASYKDFLASGGEKKWQDYWEQHKAFEAVDNDDRPKYYVLIEFPYPSAEGLHVGHPRSYSALDTVARKRRMEGFNVLYPIGFDAFGLPAENYAIKTGIHPKIKTEENISNFRRQLKSIGFSFDWSREVNTTDPKYYKWTQWIFLQLYKHGLAYKAEMPINYCTSCKVGLANEEVVGGNCERCGSEVIKKTKSQWMLKITAYADRLEKDLDNVNYLEKIKLQQKNWIGRSEGAEVVFKVESRKSKVEGSNKNASDSSAPSGLPDSGRNDIVVYTTRPDTLFGATYMVLAPEHRLVEELKDRITNWADVNNYIVQARTKSDLERTELAKDKTGVELKGIKAINPANNAEIPIWISDYVLASYGTGAIMAVPAHDERDFEFAKKFELPIIEVIIPERIDLKNPPIEGKENVERQVVHAIIFDKKTRKYLCLKWKKHPWVTFPMGGVEEGEDPIAAARREVLEETGYSNLSDGKVLGGQVRAEYFAAHKDQNRIAYASAVYFEILDHKQDKISQEEQDTHDIFWLPENELTVAAMTHSEMDIWLDRLKHGDIAYTDVDRGRLINSEFLNGLVPAEAIKKMTAWLEEKGVGRSAVNYKLRDWVFSRQRYWGEPIPLVFCEKCKSVKQKVLLIHGFEGNGEGNWFPWMKEELERNGFEVFNPTMSTSEHPDMDKWLEELSPYIEQMGTNDIIVGHSLGAKAAIKLVEKADKKIGHLILVAPVLDKSSDAEYDLLSKEWVNSDIELLKIFAGQENNWNKVSNLVNSKTALFSNDDPYIKLASKESLPHDWIVSVWDHFGHFQNKKINALLDLILQNKCTGIVLLPESELPLVLPEVKEFQSGEDGQSPLAKLTDWVNTTCPQCGGPAKRETDTMPQWAGSSWYFLRYIDPHNDAALAAPDKLKYWLKSSSERNFDGIDWYNGGMEHTTLHLLYSRFWHKFLFDIGVVPTSEPYAKRTSHGMVLGEGGEKMSKSRGNVVNPDDVVRDFGADTLRVYEMFMGPFDQAIPWDTKGVVGVRRFLDRVWTIYNFEDIKLVDEISVEQEVLLNQTIKKVGDDIEKMGYNTAISQLMILTNKIYEDRQISRDAAEKLTLILSPFAPHLAEELWAKLGHTASLSTELWPQFDPAKIIDAEIELPVQINGKVRAKLKVAVDISEAEAVELAKQDPNVARYLTTEPKKVIFIKGKMISFVV